MLQEIKQHKYPYLILITVMVVLTVIFFAVWPEIFLMRIVAFIMCAFYTLWGILTHVKTKVLSRRVVMEYVVVGLLGLMLVLIVTI